MQVLKRSDVTARNAYAIGDCIMYQEGWKAAQPDDANSGEEGDRIVTNVIEGNLHDDRAITAHTVSQHSRHCK